MSNLIKKTWTDSSREPYLLLLQNLIFMKHQQDKKNGQAPKGQWQSPSNINSCELWSRVEPYDMYGAT